MGLVVEHGGGDVTGVADEILPDDDHGQAGGGHILLRARVQHAELGHVDGLGQDAGGNIRDKRHAAGVGQLVILGAVDGVVHADVEIVGVGSEGGGIQLRYVGEGLILGAGHHMGLAVAGSLLVRLVGPLAGDDEVGLAAAVHQVEREHGELGGGTALEKQHLVGIRNPHDLAQQGLALLDDGVIGLGAMGHLHHRLPRAVIIQHFLGRGLQNAFGKHRGAGGKIIHSCHVASTSIRVIESIRFIVLFR